MKLPTEPQSPNLSPTAFKWLIMAESGMGKSSFLASIPNILITDPDAGCQALPGYIVQVRNWMDCKDLLKTLQKGENLSTYSWIGIDLLNVIYEFCYNSECKRMGVIYPSDLDGGKGHGKGWAIITKEFIGWLRDMGNLGLPLIGTCHINMVEVEVKARKFYKATPSFPGSGATSTYRRIKEAFDIVGYLTFDTDMQKVDQQKDLRKEIAPSAQMIGLTDKQMPELSTTRVIHFQPSQYWDAQDTSRQLPSKVTLSDNWEEDWGIITKEWGKEK